MNSSMSNNKSQSGTEWKIIQKSQESTCQLNINAQYGPAKSIYLRIPTPTTINALPFTPAAHARASPTQKPCILHATLEHRTSPPLIATRFGT